MTKDNRVGQIEVIVFRMEKKIPYFLLLKRNPKRGGFWQAITGGIEPDKENINTVKRELIEEAGITKYKKIFKDVFF